MRRKRLRVQPFERSDAEGLAKAVNVYLETLDPHMVKGVTFHHTANKLMWCHWAEVTHIIEREE